MTQKKEPIRHNLEIQLGEKVAICRCWQSKKMPFCDGSHRAYNEKNNEIMGPAIISAITKDD